MSSPRYSIIPAGAVTDRTLEPRDLQVLCLLGRHTDDLGWCRRSQVKMAGELDCGRATLQRALERLVEAGWVQMKRRDITSDDDAGKQPSASYAYRVMLDRDDDVEGCPPAGTPDSGADPGPDSPAGPDVVVPAGGHPGAHPERAPGAHAYMGTKNDPLERPHLERERERAREVRDKGEHEAIARFLGAFETRWPSAAIDDRQRTAYAAAALSAAQRDAALGGIAAFLAEQKRLGRKGCIAGWKYLEETRWELLPKPSADAPAAAIAHAAGSDAALAILRLHDVALLGDFARRVYRAADGGVLWRGELTPRLLALAQAPPRTAWVALDHQQAAAWDHFLAAHVAVDARRRLSAGCVAPWLWPPKKDGTVYADGDEMTDNGGAAA